MTWAGDSRHGAALSWTLVLFFASVCSAFASAATGHFRRFRRPEAVMARATTDPRG